MQPPNGLKKSYFRVRIAGDIKLALLAEERERKKKKPVRKLLPPVALTAEEKVLFSIVLSFLCDVAFPVAGGSAAFAALASLLAVERVRVVVACCV